MKIEYDILNLLQKLRTPFLDEAMKWITNLGTHLYLFYLIGFILLLYYRTRKQGISLLIAMTLADLLTKGLKVVIKRPRPFHLVQINLITPYLNSYSLPSLHVTGVFAFAYIISTYYKKLSFISYLFAILMSLSRMYLYVQFPSDVLLSLLFGILIGKFTILLIDNKKFLNYVSKTR